MLVLCPVHGGASRTLLILYLEAPRSARAKFGRAKWAQAKLAEAELAKAKLAKAKLVKAT